MSDTSRTSQRVEQGPVEVPLQPQLEHEEGTRLDGAHELLGLEGGEIGLRVLCALAQERVPESDATATETQAGGGPCDFRGRGTGPWCLLLTGVLEPAGLSQGLWRTMLY